MVGSLICLLNFQSVTVALSLVNNSFPLTCNQTMQTGFAMLFEPNQGVGTARLFKLTLKLRANSLTHTISKWFYSFLVWRSLALWLNWGIVGPTRTQLEAIFLSKALFLPVQRRLRGEIKIG